MDESLTTEELWANPETEYGHTKPFHQIYEPHQSSIM